MKKRTWITISLLLGMMVILAGALGQQALGLTPAGTIIENRAHVDYKDANGNPLPTVYSDWVYTEVAQVCGVDVTPESSTRNGEDGTEVYFPASIINTGNGADYFDLSLDIADLPLGWSATIYPDSDCDATPDSLTPISTTPSLAQDDNYCVVVSVSIPGGEANFQSGDTVLTAISNFNPACSDSGVYTTVVQSATIYLTKSASSETPRPRDIVTYTIEGGNQGSTTAKNVVISDEIPTNTTYLPDSLRYATTVGVTYHDAIPLSDADDVDMGHYDSGTNTVVWEWEDCPSGCMGSLYFQVQVNDGIAAGTWIPNRTRVDYENELGQPLGPVYSSQILIEVAVLADVSISPTSQATSADPGDEVVYPLTVCNEGNKTDVFDITYFSDKSWSYTFYFDINGNGTYESGTDTPLTDTDGDGTIDTGAIAQNVCVAILAVAIIPAGIPDQQKDTTTVTATSSNDTGVSASAELKTTCTAPNMTLIKSVDPTGAQPPGTVLTYRIDYQNIGTGSATLVVVTDTLPMYTTYTANSMYLNGVGPKTDIADADEVTVSGGVIVINVGSVGASGSGYLTYQVTID